MKAGQEKQTDNIDVRLTIIIIFTLYLPRTTFTLARLASQTQPGLHCLHVAAIETDFLIYFCTQQCPGDILSVDIYSRMTIKSLHIYSYQKKRRM